MEPPKGIWGLSLCYGVQIFLSLQHHGQIWFPSQGLGSPPHTLRQGLGSNTIRKKMNQPPKRTGQVHSVSIIVYCARPSTDLCLCRWELTVWQRHLQELTIMTQTKLDGVPCLPGERGPSLHSDRRRYPVALGVSPALTFQTSNMAVHF